MPTLWSDFSSIQYAQYYCEQETRTIDLTKILRCGSRLTNKHHRYKIWLNQTHRVGLCAETSSSDHPRYGLYDY